jgi:hypothetical protein
VYFLNGNDALEDGGLRVQFTVEGLKAAQFMDDSGMVNSFKSAVKSSVAGKSSVQSSDVEVEITTKSSVSVGSVVVFATIKSSASNFASAKNELGNMESLIKDLAKQIKAVSGINTFTDSTISVEAMTMKDLGWKAAFSSFVRSCSQEWKLVDAGSGGVYLTNHCTGRRLQKKCPAESTTCVAFDAFDKDSADTWESWLVDTVDGTMPCVGIADTGSRRFDDSLCPGTIVLQPNSTDSNGVDPPLFSCTAAHDNMRQKWEAWKKVQGKRLLEAMEVETFNRQYQVMQDAYQEWKNWEEGQDEYISEVVEVAECSLGKPVMRGLESGGRLKATGKHAWCRLGGCEIHQCVKATTGCKMGEMTSERSFECFERSSHKEKNLDYMLIGFFQFFLFLCFSICSGCLSTETSVQSVTPQGMQEKVMQVVPMRQPTE